MHNCNILITMAQSEQLVLQAVLHPTFIHMVFVACDTGVLYGSIFSVCMIAMKKIMVSFKSIKVCHK